MPEIKGPPFYDIEYATAHYEAVTARAKAAITLLIDGPTPRNGHLAHAVKTLLDDEAARLEAATKRLKEAVARHYADPTHREVSEANRQRVRELAALTERYDRHMRSCFAQFKKSLPDFTPESVWLTMVLMPVINAPAVAAAQRGGHLPQRSRPHPTGLPERHAGGGGPHSRAAQGADGPRTSGRRPAPPGMGTGHGIPGCDRRHHKAIPTGG